jgi:pilus assembly protein CpaE
MPAPALAEISRKDFEGSIERKVDVVLPFDPKLAMQAAKLGKPIAEVGKASKFGQGMSDLARLLLETVDGEGGSSSASGGTGKSLLDKVSDLKSLLPAKKTKAA